MTNHPASDHSPSWSPDGQKIAFTVGLGGNYEVYTMSAINSIGKTNITNSPAADRVRAWK